MDAKQIQTEQNLGILQLLLPWMRPEQVWKLMLTQGMERCIGLAILLLSSFGVGLEPLLLHVAFLIGSYDFPC